MTHTPIIDPGRFNRQLTIENEVSVSDGCGGFVTQMEAQDTVWADISPLRSSATVEAGTKTIEHTYRITIRFRPGISERTRFATGTRRFQVTSARDLDETKRYLECDCVEKK